MKKKRYKVEIRERLRTRDFSIVIIDNRSKNEIEIPGYASERSARTGFTNYSRNLFQKENIEVSWQIK